MFPAWWMSETKTDCYLTPKRHPGENQALIHLIHHRLLSPLHSTIPAEHQLSFRGFLNRTNICTGNKMSDFFTTWVMWWTKEVQLTNIGIDCREERLVIVKKNKHALENRYALINYDKLIQIDLFISDYYNTNLYDNIISGLLIYVCLLILPLLTHFKILSSMHQPVSK